jgi:hypothetical protein
MKHKDFLSSPDLSLAENIFSVFFHLHLSLVVKPNPSPFLQKQLMTEFLATLGIIKFPNIEFPVRQVKFEDGSILDFHPISGWQFSRTKPFFI